MPDHDHGHGVEEQGGQYGDAQEGAQRGHEEVHQPVEHCCLEEGPGVQVAVHGGLEVAHGEGVDDVLERPPVGQGTPSRGAGVGQEGDEVVGRQAEEVQQRVGDHGAVGCACGLQYA